MTPENFTYWLQGFFEVSETEELTSEQTAIIKDHLALVFKKETPDRSININDRLCNITDGLYVDGVHPNFNLREHLDNFVENSC